MKKVNNKKGFTLAELLVVVAIIAILVAVAIPVFSGAMDNAKMRVDEANIRSAYAQYTVDQMVTNNGTVATADIAAVRTALGNIGVTKMEYYTTVTIPSNGSRWTPAGGSTGCQVTALTETTP